MEEEKRNKLLESGKGALLWVLLAICIVVAVLITTRPMYAPLAERIAVDRFDSYVQNFAQQQVMNKYPNVPVDRLQPEIDEFYSQMKSSEDYDNQLNALILNLKGQVMDSNGHLYMQDIDSYFFLRQAGLVQEHGDRGDTLIDGKEYDLFMYAPEGGFVSADKLHGYFLAYFSSVLSFFNGQPLEYNIFWYPVFVMICVVILFFFLAKKIAGVWPAFLSTLLLLSSQGIVMRILYGHADNDSWNVFFPIIITMLFYLMYNSDSLKKRIIYGVLAGLLVGVYASAWLGFWFIMYLLLASSFIYVVYELFRKRSVKDFVLGCLAFIGMSILSIVLLRGSAALYSMLITPFRFFRMQDVGLGTIWPNVFTTVAEQNLSSYSAIISIVGGSVLFIAAAVGILWCLFKKKNVWLTSFLIMAVLATLVASTRGVRYVLFLVPPLLLAVALGFEALIDGFGDWVESEMSLKKHYFVVVSLLLIGLLLVVPSINKASSIASNDLPNMNDGWYNSLTKIEAESSSDAMITSWWDFGHWFKSIADRRVNFDGTSQNTPKAHWVGKLLLTDDENLSRNIMRMLDCGGNSAYQALLLGIDDTSDLQSLYLRKDEVASVDRQHESVDKVYAMLNGSAIPEYLQPLMNCSPSEGYLILSEDMIGKSGVWAHFGSWNFDRAHIVADKNAGEDVGEYGQLLSGMTNAEVNSWIAPWPAIYGNVGGCGKDNESLICSMSVNNNDFSFKFDSDFNLETSLNGKPSFEVAYEQNGKLLYKTYNQNASESMGISFAITPDRTRIYLMSPELLHSVFVRGFVYGGIDFENFELFSYEKSAFGEVYVYKVRW